MLVVLIVVAAAIVAGVVVVALGRGGEMAQFMADYAPVDLDNIDEVTATDVALLRLPRALWGYHMQATDRALGLIARTLTDRDVEIATLLRQLAEARSAAESATQQSQLPPPHQPLPSRPSVRRREMAEQQPTMEQPAADLWPVQAPWSAWERRSGPAAGGPAAGIVPAADMPEAGALDAGTASAADPAAQASGSVPAADPAAPGSGSAPDPAPDSDPAIARDGR